MSQDTQSRRFGWLRDLPDLRDYLPSSPRAAPFNRLLGAQNLSGRLTINVGNQVWKLPDRNDLREWCSPVEDQGMLGSCSSQACVGMVEFYECLAFGRHIDASRLFVYKLARDLNGLQGDMGSYLRGNIGALRLFGAPPEKWWPYDPAMVDAEPPAKVYALAANFKSMVYFRLDSPQTAPDQVLVMAKQLLVAKRPWVFGVPVYQQIFNAPDGKILFPTPGDVVIGGHAMMACGYDDAMVVGQDTGAFLIRNSWGQGWGMGGYGWLPYRYVLYPLAWDLWSIMSQEWVDTGHFMV